MGKAFEQWTKRSLRTHLVATTCLLIAIALATSGFITVSRFQNAMIEGVDEEIAKNREALAATTIGYPGTEKDSPTNPFRLSPFHVTLLDYQLSPTHESPETRSGKPILHLDREWVEENLGSGFTVSGTIHQSQWRAQVYKFPEIEGFMVIALPLDPTHKSVKSVTAILFTTAALIITIASFLVFWLTTRSFRPLKAIEQTVGKVAEGDLSQRASVKNPDSEIGHLAGSLNKMFRQIEEAFGAQKNSEIKTKRFISDASHELRTPLVTIRGFSELYRQGALTEEKEVALAMERIESEAQRMGFLVEDLLTLTRADEQRPLDFEPLDLQTIAFDAMVDARASDPDRAIEFLRLEGSPSLSAPVVGDSRRLHQIVSNLVSNALRYTPPFTPIEIAVGTRSLPESKDKTGKTETANDYATSVIQVIDHGPGIPPESLEKIFERFYRDDTSRTRETGGSGLGLAIVSALTKAHHGTIVATPTEGGGATMTLSLPYMPTPENFGQPSASRSPEKNDFTADPTAENTE